METKMKKAKILGSVTVLAGLLVFSLLAVAGSLEPTAPPSPTMKTLDEVEPRIPIHASDLPLVITQSGSYYLAETINFSNPNADAISVEVNDVTIDLMGHHLIGPGSGPEIRHGIDLNAWENVEVCNGTVRRFAYGIISHPAATARGNRVIAVRAVSNSGGGIYLNGYAHVVKDCTAVGNGGPGIEVGAGATVTGSIAHNNQGGIYARYGSTLVGNTTSHNQREGIRTMRGSTVISNTAYYNYFHGIYVAGGDPAAAGTVAHNTATDNNQSENPNFAGIRVDGNCLVKGNTATGNKQNNIWANGPGNSIEENLVVGSTGNGIRFYSTGNFYANNRASGNETNYAAAVSQTDGGGNVEF